VPAVSDRRKAGRKKDLAWRLAAGGWRLAARRRAWYVTAGVTGFADAAGSPRGITDGRSCSSSRWYYPSPSPNDSTFSSGGVRRHVLRHHPAATFAGESK